MRADAYRKTREKGASPSPHRLIRTLTHLEYGLRCLQAPAIREDRLLSDILILGVRQTFIDCFDAAMVCIDELLASPDPDLSRLDASVVIAQGREAQLIDDDWLIFASQRDVSNLEVDAEACWHRFVSAVQRLLAEHVAR